MPQRVKDGALAALAPTAAADHPFELRGHPLQVTEPGLNVHQVHTGEPVDISQWPAARIQTNSLTFRSVG